MHRFQTQSKVDSEPILVDSLLVLLLACIAQTSLRHSLWETIHCWPCVSPVLILKTDFAGPDIMESNVMPTFYRKQNVKRKTVPPTFLSPVSEHIGVAIWECNRQTDSGTQKSLDVKLGDIADGRSGRSSDKPLVVRQTWSVERLPEVVEAIQALAHAFATDDELDLPRNVRDALMQLSIRLERVTVPSVAEELSGQTSYTYGVNV